ncbi:MAG: DUF5916 domain-containing protein [Candidatus Moduliflexus flocculans]|nr:DUF5916 domain-containing protein [Candidatus Moduliflexus flocculans]
MKYGLSANMVMDLTVNTDFAQVESDEQQINLTRFSLYYPEKRMFFLNGRVSLISTWEETVISFTAGESDSAMTVIRCGFMEE